MNRQLFGAACDRAHELEVPYLIFVRRTVSLTVVYSSAHHPDSYETGPGQVLCFKEYDNRLMGLDFSSTSRIVFAFSMPFEPSIVGISATPARHHDPRGSLWQERAFVGNGQGTFAHQFVFAGQSGPVFQMFLLSLTSDLLLFRFLPRRLISTTLCPPVGSGLCNNESNVEKQYGSFCDAG